MNREKADVKINVLEEVGEETLQGHNSLTMQAKKVKFGLYISGWKIRASDQISNKNQNPTKTATTNKKKEF